jgi:Tfp pilus assembly protein PilF
MKGARCCLFEQNGILIRYRFGKPRLGVTKLWRSDWAVPLTIFLVGIVGLPGPCGSVALAQTSPAPSKPSKSWTDTITTPFKEGYDKVAGAFSPKAQTAVAQEDEAISLKSKGKAGPELFVAVARLYEQSNKWNDAEQQYKLGLQSYPNDLALLLGCAQLKERLGKPDEAIEQYQKAVKIYPKQAACYNNLGLCFARQNRLDEAFAALSRAVQLEPKNPLYRNNIAAVLVDQGRLRDAFQYLREVHGEAAAHYNMGYLLNKKGQTQAALQQFSLATQVDPSMTAARQWVLYLEKTITQERLAQHPTADGVRITSSVPQGANRTMPMSTESELPRFPISVPSASDDISANAPPPAARSARAAPNPIRPLPPVY